ncbi:choice-of-anchor M domain-containing protein [Solwaraspora sp. WMMB335]|uniref:choice-of-anchor M domain-containing protein n=1 Tax=Solwaraspora sp. WMMB335 TaxID=3404118 RepID=UPI003B950F3F
MSKSRLRRLVALAAGSALATGAVLMPSSGAPAAEGPAPDPVDIRVLAGIHTDAVSTFLDDGVLELDLKADVPEGNGTRFADEDVWFHVTDAAQVSVPSGFEFIAPVDSTVWIAPETNPNGPDKPARLWPGFSTESIALGAIDDDETSLTLVGVDGPGALELFTNPPPFGGDVTRLWSSDESGFESFTVGRTHMHANWAFTAAGTYEVTVEASVAISGVTQTDTATYTFVVGGLPEQVVTSTEMHVHGDSAVTVGTDVEFHATVSPSTVEGYVEYYDGSTVLGHEPVVDGEAEFETDALTVGSHDVTAVFVPAVTNLAAGSTSDPVTVTVTNDDGVEFALTGIEDSYQPGDTLTATVVGHTLDPDVASYGQKFAYYIRQVGSTTARSLGIPTTSYTLSRVLGANDDGYELSVQLRNCTSYGCSSSSTHTVVGQTAWVPINVVTEGTPPTVSLVSGATEMYPGDTIRIEASGLNLADGETTKWVWHVVGGTWNDFSSTLLPVAEEASLELTQSYLVDCGGCSGEAAIQVLNVDGIVVRQSSNAISFTQTFYELLVDGLQPLYMDGATTNVTGQIYPVRESDANLTYQWLFYTSSSDLATNDNAQVWGEATGSIPPLEHQVTMADNEGYLILVALKPGHQALGPRTENYGGRVGQSQTQRVYVTDDPDAQLFFFDALSDHYHQGNGIGLNLTVGPPPLEDDEIIWEWMWPGGGWETYPGASGESHALTAEQALDGLQVRATLDFADPDKESLVAGPLTIHVDDHGASARQKPTIGGETAYGVGDTVLLSVELPADGPTILTDHLWERQAMGSDDWTPVAGESGATLSFAAAEADDGASYRVSILTPAGVLAYGPSPAVALSVQDAGGAPPVSQTIVATLDESQGALVVSVDPDDREVIMSPAQLAGSNDRWESSGVLRPVTVTDTRSGAPGWSVSAQVGDFTNDEASFSSSYLGWTPRLLDSSDGQVVTPGAVVAPGFPTGAGLSMGAGLASSAAGQSLGTAVLDANLSLMLPTSTPLGAYDALVTITAI